MGNFSVKLPLFEDPLPLLAPGTPAWRLSSPCSLIGARRLSFAPVRSGRGRTRCLPCLGPIGLVWPDLLGWAYLARPDGWMGNGFEMHKVRKCV